MAFIEANRMHHHITLSHPHLAAVQGESNTGIVTQGGDARQYNCTFQAFIRDLRSKWHQVCSLYA